MTQIKTDLNVPPYFDDYDEDKKFHRVLFRPSRAVQARELTQLQTIHQKQIEKFGASMFKDGSIIDGVGIQYFPKVPYISVKDTFSNSSGGATEDSPTDFDSTYLLTNSQDSNTAVRAKIRIAKNGFEANHPETNRFYLDYVYTGRDASNNNVDEFNPGETLYIYSSSQSKSGTLDANNIVATVNTLATNSTFTSNGTAYCISVSDGTIFQKGFFSKVSEQTITVRDYSTNVTGYVVGFETTESIITENEDSSLLDNALGYENENAPGASRLKLDPVLVAKTREDTSNTNFFAIVEFDGNEPTTQNDEPELKTTEIMLADRMYDGFGNFIVNPFTVDTKGTSNTSTFEYKISSGEAYIRGYNIEKIGSSIVPSYRATNTNFAQNQYISANYGNYVNCNEFAGMFDVENFAQVDIYDQPQAVLTNSTGFANTGTVVGTANIKAVSYSSGTRGTPSAVYKIYLFNIVMNSGKSFSKDAKSLYAGTGATFGEAVADIVLENDSAVLKNSNVSKLYFDSNIRAVKRLTNNTGIIDTDYSYTQIKAGTIDSSGNVSITIDLAGPGSASEEINTTRTNDFKVTLAANAVSANLSGTVSVNTTTRVVTGSGTSFDTDFVAGDQIIVYDSGNETETIVSVTNSTSMTVTNFFGFTNATSSYAKSYLEGKSLPISIVANTSNTSFIISTGESFDSSETVYCSYPVRRKQVQPIPKVINKGRFVKIDCSNTSAGGITGPWNLGLVDVHKITNVYVGTTYSDSNTDRSNWFKLDNGQRDNEYSQAKLVLKPEYASNITSGTKILAKVDFFTANTSTSVGFFSVESYPIDDANTANTNAIQTISIPYHNNINLRNVIDFRPRVYNTANVNATDAAGATESPAANTTYNIPAGGAYHMAPDTNFVADFEYYLPRYDLVTINSKGEFGVVRGSASENPRPPTVQEDQMVIAEAYIPPYPSATRSQFETEQNPNLPYIQPIIKNYKRYKMKDIQSLEKRIEQLEYYVTLNALEQAAVSLTITDANGLDRYKNGIFADPFTSHENGNVEDIEYKIAIDSKLSIARPFFVKEDIDYQYNSSNSSNITRTGRYLTLPYTSEKYISQRFATNTRNTTTAFWNWSGSVDLYPSFDYHREEDVAPATVVSIDNTENWDRFAASSFGTRWGEWTTVDTSTETSVSGLTTTTTTNTTESRNVTTIQVTDSTTSYDLGTYVTDVSINPYIRERLVAFVAYNMKPNTIIYPFFDNVLVSAHCAPGALSGLSTFPEGLENRVVSRTGNYGDALVTDENGFVCGIFRIPPETFRTGDREFELFNVDDLIVGEDSITTSAQAIYTADSVSVTKGSTTLSVTQPQVSASTTTQSRVISSTTTETAPSFPVIEEGDPGVTPEPEEGDPNPPGWDPVCQSFTITNIPAGVTGVQITQIGLYFKTKDPNLGMTVYICEMQNGFPDSNRIIGQGRLESASITVSDDASAESIFVLNEPVFLLTNTDYAFIAQPDGNSPEYNIWVGSTGGTDIATGEQVFSNPYSGVMFISSNKKTWEDIQSDDIKFNIYRARYTSGSGIAVLDNENDESLVLDGFTKANSSLTIKAGQSVYTVNASANTSNAASIVSNTLSSDIYGYVQYIKENDAVLWLDSSTANSSSYFVNNDIVAIYETADPSNTSLLNANTLIAWGTIQEVRNHTYHAIVPKFSIMTPSKTAIEFRHRGTSTASVLDTSNTIVQNNVDYEFFDKERHVMSRSNELVSLSGNKSSRYYINLSTQSDFVSPVINLGQKSSYMIENKINNDATNEHTRYGNSETKYVSKRIVLADGQESEDIKVYLTAYRPVDTDIKVYAKFKNNEDPDAFDDKVWTELEYENGSNLTYSTTSTGSNKQYIEYVFNVPSSNSVDYAAFANVTSETPTELTGTVTLVEDSFTITGVGSSFDTELSVGDRIKLISDDGYSFNVRTVTNITNSTSLTVDQGWIYANSSGTAAYVFSSTGGNDGIVEYENSTGSRFVGYKEVALKIVLLSSNPVNVPFLKDVRAICLQV